MTVWEPAEGDIQAIRERSGPGRAVGRFCLLIPASMPSKPPLPTFYKHKFYVLARLSVRLPGFSQG